jgi:hypothetical protein
VNWIMPFMLLSVVGMLAGVVVALVAFPQPVLLRQRHQGRLRRKLATLPAPQRSAVLLPLRGEGGEDMRKITASLLRNFGLPTEVSPAGAPAGRGDEPTAAE